jgi:DNA-binding transcriptional MerR regulator
MKELGPAEFSAATGLSVKALRLYDERGLLVPARAGQSTGYRRYAEDQIATAGRIALLRRAGIGLAEIERFPAAPSGAVVDRWRADLATETAARRRDLEALAAALGFDTSRPMEPPWQSSFVPWIRQRSWSPPSTSRAPSSTRLSITPTNRVSPNSKPPNPESANYCWLPRTPVRSWAPPWASRPHGLRSP